VPAGLVVAALVLLTTRQDASDTHRREVAQMAREFGQERVELDRIQRELAAYEASNRVAEDEIKLLSNPKP
jgi:hypothetical protein